MWEFTREGDETSVIRGFYGKRTIAAMQTLLFTSKDQYFRAEVADIGYRVKRIPGKFRGPALLLAVCIP